MTNCMTPDDCLYGIYACSFSLSKASYFISTLYENRQYSKRAHRCFQMPGWYFSPSVVLFLWFERKTISLRNFRNREGTSPDLHRHIHHWGDQWTSRTATLSQLWRENIAMDGRSLAENRESSSGCCQRLRDCCSLIIILDELTVTTIRMYRLSALYI